MPVNYVGKAPSVTIAEDVADIKEAVEDILTASGSREVSLELPLVHGAEVTSILTTDPTVFKVAGTDVLNTAPEEIFRFTVSTPETGVKAVQSLSLALVWETQVITAGAGVGESYWQVGVGASPSTWRTITDVVAASEVVTEHERSGNFLPTEATALPFTLRLVGRVFVGGDALRTDILSSSTLKITYQVE